MCSKSWENGTKRKTKRSRGFLKPLLSDSKPLKSPIEITCVNRQTVCQIKEPHLRSFTECVLDFLAVRGSAITLHFVDCDTITKLHSQYFGKQTCTDCITFPCDAPGDTEDYTHLGDVFLCPQVALEYGQKHAIAPEQELARYLIHTLLHIAGLKDESKTEALHMRAREDACLQHFAKIPLETIFHF